MKNSFFKLSILTLMSAFMFVGCSDDDYTATDTEEDEDETTETTVNNSDFTVGLIYKTDDVADGYTLFSPIRSTNTYLIDNCGDLVQTWSSDYTPQGVYMLENGHILRSATLTAVNSEFESAGGQTGRVELFNTDGDLYWYYEFNSATEFMHHDLEYIESTGTVMVMVWEKHTVAEVEAAGRTNATALWSERIVEIDPSTDEIVWEWDAWDHLVQDENPDEDNYGILSDNPQLLNINYTYEASDYEADWLHMNGVDYNETLDQIVVSSRNFSEFFIIDHSTTTTEAASHSGGTYGKGGDILYRWGNPQTYDMGDDSDQKLFVQHNANWINSEYQDGGQIMVFNNQTGYYEGIDYSTIDVIDTNVNTDGSYSLNTDGTYAPTDFTWTYEANPSTDFYAANISGARRLSNGNTIICEGTTGTFFEVDYDGNTVWKYVNPVDETGAVDQYSTPSRNFVFRCEKYESDYEGLAYYTLESQGTIESGSDYECE
ncbi:aryl-sulfate sulfotransferase [Neotamlana laminarinivorans]|uniref:Aryl-sulfate sulfotransferase n=1 Tax=Neotamlana laminarinivorans TaxID=2883124 RepID=A0A9X1I466_9FLAO|nr:aryl-sulfate sulfotransferase [Tamlana laminarinivorans]MCB4799892.1 aryl-sulfate sulfotransferase [Tamlana laminarinivorans]